MARPRVGLSSAHRSGGRRIRPGRDGRAGQASAMAGGQGVCHGRRRRPDSNFQRYGAAAGGSRDRACRQGPRRRAGADVAVGRAGKQCCRDTGRLYTACEWAVRHDRRRARLQLGPVAARARTACRPRGLGCRSAWWRCQLVAWTKSGTGAVARRGKRVPDRLPALHQIARQGRRASALRFVGIEWMASDRLISPSCLRRRSCGGRSPSFSQSCS